jgi:hypothetical protein
MTDLPLGGVDLGVVVALCCSAGDGDLPGGAPWRFSE